MTASTIFRFFGYSLRWVREASIAAGPYLHTALPRSTLHSSVKFRGPDDDGTLGLRGRVNVPHRINCGCRNDAQAQQRPISVLPRCPPLTRKRRVAASQKLIFKPVQGPEQAGSFDRLLGAPMGTLSAMMRVIGELNIGGIDEPANCIDCSARTIEFYRAS